MLKIDHAAHGVDNEPLNRSHLGRASSRRRRHIENNGHGFDSTGSSLSTTLFDKLFNHLEIPLLHGKYIIKLRIFVPKLR